LCRTTGRLAQKEITLKFYKVLLYGSKCWNSTKQQIDRTETEDMGFVRAVGDTPN